MIAPLPEAEDRAQAQRERILAAARACFVEHGFDAASMANIASAARMSPGLIYRYFGGKADIVRAIIDRQLEGSAAILDSLRSPADLVAAILAAFERWQEPADQEMSPALCLETAAAATRDREVAEATRAADALVDLRLQEVLRRSLPAGAGEAAVRRRALLLHSLIDGLMVRALRDPDVDRELLRAAVEELVGGLLEG